MLMLTCLPAAPQPQQPVPTGACRRQRGPCGSSLPGVSQGFAFLGRGSGSFACCAGDVGFGLRMEKISSWKLSHLLERVILTHYQLLGWGSSSALLCPTEVVEGFSASFPIPQIPPPPQAQSHQRGRSQPCLVSPVPLRLEGHTDSWAATSPRPVPYTAPARSLYLTPWQPPPNPSPLCGTHCGAGDQGRCSVLGPGACLKPGLLVLSILQLSSDCSTLSQGLTLCSSAWHWGAGIERAQLVLLIGELLQQRVFPQREAKETKILSFPPSRLQMLTELLQRGGHVPGPGRK